MAGLIQFRRDNCIDGSTECAPHPAADARSAAIAAACGTQAPTLHLQEDRPATPGADRDPGPDDAAPGSEPRADSKSVTVVLAGAASMG